MKMFKQLLACKGATALKIRSSVSLTFNADIHNCTHAYSKVNDDVT